MNHASLPALLLLTTQLSLPGADWQPVPVHRITPEKPGYGGLCGIVVDHETGDVFVDVSDLGFYRSADQGETWKHVPALPLKGRTETPGCWTINPTGENKTMVTALVYGAPITVGTESASRFKHFDKRSEHIDWCAVDWTDPAMGFVLALKHEQAGLLIASNDGGQSFRDVGKGFISGWVFDGKTAVVAREGPEPTLQRTTDAGHTFVSCGGFMPAGNASARALPKWKDGSLYWLTRQGLIVTDDKGLSWNKLSDVPKGLYGPVFGKTVKHQFLVTTEGVVESLDGGITWSKPIPPPAELGGLAGLTWLEYDPQHDVLYLMKMTSDLFRLNRGG
jgi:hypothetical protein